MINRNNFQLSQEFLQFQLQSKLLAAASVERYRFYLRHWLLWLDDIPIGKAPQKLPLFPRYLAIPEERDREAKILSSTTSKKIIRVVKLFLEWLRIYHPDALGEISREWINSLRSIPVPPKNHQRVYISLEEAITLATCLPSENDLALHRDKAAAALLFLSGMRVGAFATLPIEAVDLSNQKIRQWTELGVHTKGQKSATTILLNIPELLAVAKSWDTIIREQLPPTAMWYTPIISCWGEQNLSPEKPGKNRIVAVGRRMRLLFRRAGLPYKSPHKFRHGHAVYCLQRAKDMGDMKAISINLMHVNTQTTDGIYGPFMESEIQYRISNLNKPQASLIGFSPESMHFPKGVSDEDLAVMFRAWADRLSTKSMTPL